MKNGFKGGQVICVLWRYGTRLLMFTLFWLVFSLLAYYHYWNTLGDISAYWHREVLRYAYPYMLMIYLASDYFLIIRPRRSFRYTVCLCALLVIVIGYLSVSTVLEYWLIKQRCELLEILNHKPCHF